MCGIAGWCLSTDDMSTINTRKLAKALALGIEDRGPHATGVAFRTPTGSSPIQIHKKNVTATEFVKRMVMPRSAQVGLVHTRFATQGDPKDNNNNHPIYNGGIVGVHNGHVTNDNELFNLVYEAGGERHGQVDSEAIFAAIAWNVARWPTKNVQLADVLEGVRGGAAIAYLDESDPDNVLHISRLNSSPLVMSWTTGGSLIFASTMVAIKDAAAKVGVDIAKTLYVVEGIKYTVIAGEINAQVEFTPPWRSQYAYTGKTYVQRSVGSMVESWEDRYSTNAEPISLPAAEPVRLVQVLNEIEADLTEDITSTLSVGRVDGSLHWESYGERERAITRFRDSFSTTLPGKKAELLTNFHAFRRVGDWVRTTLQGVETLGQVYDLPNTFPHGHYLLRVEAWTEKGVEWVMVARTHTEFTYNVMDENTRTEGDLEATAALSARLAEATVEEENAELMLEWSMANANA